jgi:hypothetical protein
VASDVRWKSSDTTFLKKVNGVNRFSAQSDQIFVKIRTFFDGIFMSDIIPYYGDSFRDSAVNGVEDKSKSPVLKERLKTEVKRVQNSAKNGRARVKQRLRRSREYN